MMRDYAKKGASKNRKKRKTSRLRSWLIVISLFVVFTFGLVFFGKYRAKHAAAAPIAQVSSVAPDLTGDQIKKIEKNKDKSKAKEKTKLKHHDGKNSDSKVAATVTSASEEMPPPKFDFYTILPEKNDNKAKLGYEIEALVTKDRASAENLKTQIGLLGLVAEITTMPKNAGQVKYRVSIGPYDDKAAAALDLV